MPDAKLVKERKDYSALIKFDPPTPYLHIPFWRQSSSRQRSRSGRSSSGQRPGAERLAAASGNGAARSGMVEVEAEQLVAAARAGAAAVTAGGGGSGQTPRWRSEQLQKTRKIRMSVSF